MKIDGEDFSGKKTVTQLSPSQQKIHNDLCDSGLLHEVFKKQGLGSEIPDAFCRGDYAEAAKLVSRLPDDKADLVMAQLRRRGYEAGTKKSISTLGKGIIAAGGAVALFFIIMAGTGNWPFDGGSSGGGASSGGGGGGGGAGAGSF